MTVRYASAGDIDGIMKLLYQVAEVHHRGRPDLFKGGCTKYGPEELKKIIEDKNTPVFVAADGDGNILGHAFCVLKRTAETHVLEDRLTMYIDDICVDENHRGKHIGTSLCRKALEAAKEAGCYNVTLNVWSLNAPAMEFYKAVGFAEQKITMEKIL